MKTPDPNTYESQRQPAYPNPFAAMEVVNWPRKPLGKAKPGAGKSKAMRSGKSRHKKSY